MPVLAGMTNLLFASRRGTSTITETEVQYYSSDGNFTRPTNGLSNSNWMVRRNSLVGIFLITLVLIGFSS